MHTTKVFAIAGLDGRAIGNNKNQLRYRRDGTRNILPSQIPNVVRNYMTSRLHLLLIFSPFLVNGQNNYDSSKQKVRNVIWTIPVFKNTTINGLSIGLTPATWGKAKRLKVNGVSISAAPWDPFISVYMLFSSYSFSKDTNDNRRNSFNSSSLYPDPDSAENIRTNGLIIGTITGANVSNGVNISVFANASPSMNGLSVSGLFNHHYNFNGVLIAAIRNKTTTGKGLQIALFNSCKSGRVVQLGLINKIGNRIIPFINVQFSK